LTYNADLTPSTSPVAVITGGSAGVGRATALAFARRGWRVALLARGRDRLESARTQVEAAGGGALPIPTDVADADAVFAAADRVVAEWGRIDVWVNNAMATIFAPADRVSPAEFERVTQVTYLGQVHGTLAALRQMRRQGHGTIVQIGSALSYRSIPLQSAYCAAKFAVRGFTDSLRSELAHEGSPIRLTMVQLPAVNTPQFDWARSRLPSRLQPVPPIFQPEPIAEQILWAADHTPRELWVGGPTMQAILGTMALPGWLDRVVARRAWEGQMTGRPAPGGADGNLFEAPIGDPGSHGRFDPRSRARVFAARESYARAGLAALGAALGLGIALTSFRVGRRISAGAARSSARLPSGRADARTGVRAR
jgi:NAD(P)-dependent dehydrogenase (short-subunit alcohol dehydrogenase family)